MVRVRGFQFDLNSSTTQDIGLVVFHLDLVHHGGVFHYDSVAIQTPNLVILNETLSSSEFGNSRDKVTVPSVIFGSGEAESPISHLGVRPRPRARPRARHKF